MLEPSWVGRRVSIRRAVDGAEPSRPAYSDVVGDLLGLDAETAVVETRRGPVRVPVAGVVIARLAAPSTADELALEAVAASGWRADQTGAIGGWVLRASGGFTSRANSVLPLRAPGVPLDDALAAAAEWYAARGLPLQLQVPTEARRLLDAELGERGWPATGETHVLAARLDCVAEAPPGPPVELAAEPDDGWLGRFRDGAGRQPAARALVARHDRVRFAAIRDGGRTVAIGRGAIDDAWLGITGVEVAADQRRRGLASAIMAALCGWGRAEGAVRSYLQVEAGNEPALALYARLGYWFHHGYHYRVSPR